MPRLTDILVAIALGAAIAPNLAADTVDPVAAEQRLRERTSPVQPLPDSGSGITRDAGSIAIIEHDGSSYSKEADGAPNYAARAAVAQRFFAAHGDAYDFLVVFTGFDFETGTSIGFFNPVRNSVRGIGKPTFDVGSFFGSPGRLAGYVDMATLDRYRTGNRSLRPGDPGFVTTLNLAAHQIAHQWLAQVRYQDASGSASTALLGQGGAHWSYLLDSGASLMYGADWVDAGGGSFHAARVQSTLSPLDLYLMGFLDPGSVPAFTLLRNPGEDPARLPLLNATVTALPETVGLGQVIAAEGVRSPSHLQSPKTFRAGFIFLAAPGTPPSAEDLAALDLVRQALAGHFFALTRGAAVLETSLVDAPAPPASPAPDLEKALTWLLAQQSIDGRWQDSAPTGLRDTAEVLGALIKAGAPGTPHAHGLLWASGAAATNFDFTARRAMGLATGPLAAAESDALAAAIAAGQNADGGFGPGPGFESDALDTALALRALRAVGRPLDVKARAAIGALASLQLEGGGWGITRSMPSAIVTAHVVLALQDWAASPEAGPLAAGGIASMLAARNADGGFGQSPSTTYATALAVQALARAGAPPEVLDPPTAWLQQKQRADGSWEGSTYQTALVLNALRASIAPNLIVPSDGLVLDPSSPREGDTVRVTASVQNVGRAAALPTVARLFDGDPALGVLVAEAQVPALEPGAAASVLFDYPTGDRAGRRTVFVLADAAGSVGEAREDDNATSRAVVVQGRLPDLVVTAQGIAISPDLAEEGESVRIDVTVSNAGERSAPANLVRLIKGNPREGGSLIGQAAVPALAVGESVVITFDWNTAGALGVAALYAVVDPSFSLDEADETNNEASKPVEVVTAAPEGPELEAVSLTLEPASLTAVPQAIGLQAVIRNRGRERAVSTVALYDRDPPEGSPIFSWDVDLGPRSSTTLSTTRVVDQPGERTFVVVADPEDALDEIDEDNNRASSVLSDPNNTIDLEVLAGGVTVSPSDLVIGQDLEVTVQLRNRGTRFSPPVPLILGRTTPEGIVELARSTPSVSENGLETVTLLWKTSVVGEAVPLFVWADPFGEVDEVSDDNNRFDFTVRIQPSTQPNLMVAASEIALSPDPPLEGESATVSAVVRNPSRVAAPSFLVRFYSGDPQDGGTAIGEVQVPAPGLGPDSSFPASVVWSPVNVRGALAVFAVADAAGVVDEYDETDNVASRSIGVVGLPDLVIHTAEMQLAPPFPRTGESVTVTAIVRNLGAQPAPASLVRAFERELGNGVPVADVPVPPLNPGESAPIELTWSPAAPAGDRLFSLLVDPDNALHEQNKGNNLARKTVVVQDADLFLSEVYFSPDGDGVKDETTLSYRVAVPVTVVISDAAGRKVRTLPGDPAASASVVWDGRDDAARIVSDGQYRLALAGEQGQTVAQATAVVDTNRASLFDTAGTAPFGTRTEPCNLSCDGAEPPAWMPSEDAVLLFQPGSEGGSLLRVDMDGKETTIPLQGGDSLFDAQLDSPYAVAPDGRDVLLTNGGVANPDYELLIANLVSGQVRELGYLPPNTARWSPDGRFISTPARIIDREGTEIVTLPDHGSAWEWSPDGQFLASGNAIIRRDGTGLREFALPFADVEGVRFPTTRWRSDGKIYFEISDCQWCSKEWAGLLDPAAGTVTEIPWLSDSRITDVFWSPDATHVAYVWRDDFPTPTRIARADGSGAITLSSSPVFLSPRASGAAGITGGCLKIVRSLQNLIAVFKATPFGGDVGVQVKASVADQNLDFYQLEYATQGQPDVWKALGPPSEEPVFDEDLTIWVPPAPGTYTLRLRAYDRAGNARSFSQVVVWSPQALALPVIADITQTEFLISPNGDAVKDAVTFNYRVLVPTTIDVRITGPKRAFNEEAPGPTVERFTKTYTAAEIGQASFVWEGVGARDGRYTVFINNLPYRVDVDTTSPEIAFSYQGTRIQLDPGGRGADLVGDRSWYVFDEHLAEWKASGGGRGDAGKYGIYEPLRDSDGSIVMGPQFPAPVRTADGRVIGRTLSGDKLVVGLGADDAATFTAVDRAGNTTTIPIVPVPEKLYLLVGWPSGCRPAFVPPIDSETPYSFKPESSFDLAETIRGAGDEQLHFEYQVSDEAPWVAAGPSKAVSGVFSYSADFDAMGLERGRTYRGRFATESGFQSESFRFFVYDPSCKTFVNLNVKKGAPQPDPSKEEFLLDIKAVGPDPILFKDARVNVVVDSKGEAKAFSVQPTGGPASIVIERPSCDPDSSVGVSFNAVISPEDIAALGAGACFKLSQEMPRCDSLIRVGQSFVACGEGTPGTLYLDVSGVSAAPGTATVFAGGSPVASFNVGAGPFGERVIADAMDLNEGESDAVAELRTASGVQAKHLAKLFVDRTPPTASILVPAESSAVCALADEAGRERVDIQTEAVDLSPVSLLRRDFRKGTGPWQPWSCPPDLGGSADGTCPALELKSGIPQAVPWDVTGQPGGDHAVRFTFCDRSGYQQSVERGFRFVKDPPALLVTEIAAPVFSPNGDGAVDATEVGVQSFQALRYTAEVHRGFTDGEVVRTLATDEGRPEGETDFAWDGFDNNGAAAAEGEYVVVIVGTDGCGRRAQVSARLRVDLTLPTAVLTLPQPGNTVATTQDIRGTAVDDTFASYELAFGVGDDPPDWTPIREGVYPVTAGLLGRWSTPPAEDRYTLRLTVVDKGGNRATTKVHVDVTARTFLAESDVDPSLFSPNGDGRRDVTTIQYALQARGRVFVEIRDALGVTVRHLDPGTVREDGPSVTVVWDGHRNAPGGVVDDGEYFVWIRVEDPLGGGSSQEQSLSVSVDREPPTVAVDRPSPGVFLNHEATVHGSIQDPVLAEYVITATPAAGSAVELARGTQSRSNVDLAALSTLADGSYTLQVTAEDVAGNRTTHEAAFTVDSVAPHALIEVPVFDAAVKKGAAPVEVRGSVTDANLVSYTLSVGPGEAPAYFDDIVTSTTGGDAIRLGLWTVASLADGPYTLQLEAIDRAGNSSSSFFRTVVVDGVPPQAEILVPADGASVNAVPEVIANATDLNFESWQLDSAPGSPTTPFPWSPVASGPTEVQGTSLAPWTLPPDGQYTLRLTARDGAGNTVEAFSTVMVDTVPPEAPPSDLGAVVEEVTEMPVAAKKAKGAPAGLKAALVADKALRVRLTWRASAATDVAGYRVLRDGVLITPDRIEGTAFTDEDLHEGEILRYEVVAEDRAGNRGPAASVTVRADITPPEADILEPVTGAALSGSVTIRGTAFSPDFLRYRLLVSDNAEATSWTLVRQSALPVVAGVLGEWTAAGAGARTLALEAEDIAGNVKRVTVAVTIDNLPPPKLTLHDLEKSGAALGVEWNPSTANDLAGYLLYRNGRLVNASEIVLDNLRSYLLTGTSYGDRDLPDGEHCYRVLAMDSAGNLSVPSDPKCETLDNRDPHAVLVEPAAGTRFDTPIRLLAASPDGDIASVQFQIFRDGDWSDLSADISAPFEAMLDPEALGLAVGDYELRAVATDRGAHSDPSPESITVRFADTAPPPAPQGVTAHVDGGTVTLTWEPVTEPDLREYVVYRDAQRIDGIGDAVSLADEVDAGEHEYLVAAMDAEGNESAVSNRVVAVVYAVALDHRFPVTDQTEVTLAGTGARAATTIEVLRDGTVVASAPATGGHFEVPAVPLVPGLNVFVVQGVDAASNRSIPSNEQILIANTPPPAVTGLTASVSGHDVALSWNPVTDPELQGYRVRRGDRLLTESSAQTQANSTAATHTYTAFSCVPGSCGNYTFTPSLAFDGNPNTAWIASGSPRTATWTVTFPEPVLVDRIDLSFASVPFGTRVAFPSVVARYRIDALWNNLWHLPLVQVAGNTQTSVQHVLPTPFLTNSLQVTLDLFSSQGLAEVAVSKADVVPPGISSRQDLNAPDGRHSYRVTAIDQYGAEGEPGVKEVPVGDVTAPAKPTGLTTSVTGSDVLLAWNASPEPDIDHYVVLRDGNPVATAGEATYLDAARPNGHYVYSIKAVDHVGNESDESDARAADVFVAPPEAPVLSGAAAASGAVDLAWTHPGAAEFVILRSETAGGPYLSIARTADVRSFTDETAARGRAQYYVLKAIDAAGNESALSNEVSVTPERTEPADPPVIVFPTDAEHPVTADSTVTDIGGTAELDSRVSILVNGRVAGSGMATMNFVRAQSVTIPDDVLGTSFSASGDQIAYVVYEGDRYQGHVVTVATGAGMTVSRPDYSDVRKVVISPDGTRAAYLATGFHPQTGWYREDIFVRDLASGADTAVEEYDERARDAVWSPTGEFVVFVTDSPGGNRVWVRDLGTGDLRDFGEPSLDVRHLAVSPDGGKAAFLGFSGFTGQYELFVLDLGSGVYTKFDLSVDPNSPPSWSSDGQRLAYDRRVGVRAAAVVVELGSGETVEVQEGENETSDARFDPAGGWLSFREWRQDQNGDLRDTVRVEETATGERRDVSRSPIDVSSQQWLSGSRLVLQSPGRLTFFLATPEGAFEIPNVLLDAGDNLVVARSTIEPEALSTDSETVRITVPAILYADLAPVAGATATNPLVPIVGNVTTLTTQIRNLGGVAASNASVTLTVTAPNGATVFRSVVPFPPMAPGATFVASARWTPASAGPHVLRIQVDAAGLVHEASEANNDTSLAVSVVAASGLSADVQADRDTYKAQASALVRVRVVNGGNAFQGRLETAVQDGAGQRVTLLDSRPLSLAYGQKAEFNVGWNTGRTYAGDYRFQVTAFGADGVPAAAAVDAFQITPDVAGAARLTADQTSFARGKAATFAARFENRSLNAPVEGYAARLRITPDGGDVPVFESDVPVPRILPGGLWEAKLTWPAADPIGNYRAELRVWRGTQATPLARAEARFAVADPGLAVAGTLAIDPVDVHVGETFDSDITVINLGAAPITGLPVIVDLVFGPTQAVVATSTLTVDLGPGATQAATVSLSTAGLVPNGGYLVFLRTTTPAAILATSTLRVHGVIVPPTADSPADGARVATLRPTLSVNNGSAPDGLPLTYSFQVFRDVNLTNQVAGVDGLPEGTGRTSWTVPTGTAEDQIHYWRARASDGTSPSAWTAVSSFLVDTENSVPLSPVPDAPSPGERIASNQPLLTVRNALDQEFEPLLYDFRVSADAQMATVLTSATGVAEGQGLTSWRVPIVLAENTPYYWSVRARDGVGEDRASPWTPAIGFFVDTANESPAIPRLIRPVDGVSVTTLAPELVVGTVTDPEEDPIRYEFQVDTRAMFDSAALQTVADVTGGASEASWTPPAPLADNTTHYWRARASDGRTASAWAAAATFFVNLANDPPTAPTLVDPVDGRVVANATPVLTLRNATDADRDPLTYEFVVRDASGNVIASTVGVPPGASETTWTVAPSLSEDGVFAWTARAHDGTVAGSFAPAATFRVNAVLEPPTAPSPLAPPENAVLDTRQVTLVVTNATSPEGLALTYEFELYREGAGGTLTLVESITGVPEGSPTTSWTPAAELTDALYSWRARASDGTRLGPWMTSAHFRVQVDVPPAAPTGLQAVPGNATVSLTWNASPEADVVSYRVYRSTVSGGPYAFVVTRQTPSFVDTGLTNGTTYYYVVTALDARFESPRSTEAPATPTAPPTGVVTAQVRFDPSVIDGQCLLPSGDDDHDHDHDHDWDDWSRHHDGDHHGGHDDDDDDCRIPHSCPNWIYATVELPNGSSPSLVDPRTVRVGGSVRADEHYRVITDVDGDGIPEAKVRFASWRVRGLLSGGMNTLTVTGRAGAVEFRGTATILVSAITVEMKFTPQTLNRKSNGGDVQVELTFCGGARTADVSISSLRLNEQVRPKRVESSGQHKLKLKFERSAVQAILPLGNAVEVRLTGTVHGISFKGTDVIRVIQ